MDSNGAIQSSVTDLLEPYGVDPKRIYINFFDVPRANVGWDRKTFAGQVNSEEDLVWERVDL